MVNHFASLLLNTSGENLGGPKSYFTDHDYAPVSLPIVLQQFYDVLFPATSSDYHKQFLCYNYLRLINSTGMAAEVYKTDKRVSYDLDALTEYFRISQVSPPTSSDFNFKLAVYGEYTPAQENNYYYDSFTISQLGNTSTVVVRSDVTGKYLNEAFSSRELTREAEIQLDTGNSQQITLPVNIGYTGLSFSIIGPMYLFNSNPNKNWNFLAEAPFVFDFPQTFNSIATLNNTVESMLKYRNEDLNTSNENLWRMHFNEVYRFVGLLSAYVDRVNLIYASS